MQEQLVIGTRGSPLALWQANAVRDALMTAWPDFGPDAVVINEISTAGDKTRDRRLLEIGGKGLFTEEIEAGLLDQSVDIAVHSAKDVPTRLPDGLKLAGYLPRADVRDALISKTEPAIEALPEGARVGTASLRRAAQALRLRPDLKVELLRGNVGTRLKKVEDGTIDATFLAVAGLERLGYAWAAERALDPTAMLPAPGQGAIALEIRADAEAVAERLVPLLCPDTAVTLAAERASLEALDGDCRTPVAALAQFANGEILLTARLLSVDGATLFEDRAHGPRHEAATLGKSVGEALRQEAGEKFFEELKAEILGGA